LLAIALAAALAARMVALTFDDLPVAGAANPDSDPSLTTDEIRRINSAILSVLRAHRATAIGFVNERGVAEFADSTERRRILAQWIAAGNDLGNHTYSHADLDGKSVEDFQREVENGEASIAPLMASAGKRLAYFRFPMNHTGETKAKHEAVARYLAERGYQVATCTIDNEDYEFERAYRLMANDRASARMLRADYLRYTAKEIDYYAALHRQVFGREIRQVMLLHVNRLNAEVLDQVLRLFEERGYRFITLAEAQADPAFRTPDTFVSRFGPMWGYRWAQLLGVRVDGSKEQEPPAWVTSYGRGR
jgi:peptidoglycan/xylan/chitin deacetylase (PgdA/CDA1 family)